MKKLLLVILSIGIVSALLFTCASFGFASVELVNRATFPITELYLGNSEAVEKSGTQVIGPDYWGTNLLEVPLKQGDSHFSQTFPATFDIRIVDKLGEEKVFDNVTVAKDQTIVIECVEIGTYTLSVE